MDGDICRVPPSLNNYSSNEMQTSIALSKGITNAAMVFKVNVAIK
jgi:hypothetical protein